MRYRDRQGNLCKSKATAAEIMERLRQEKLSPQSEASRTLKGEFKLLEKWPEFQKVIAALRGRKKVPRAAAVRQAVSVHDNHRPPLWWWLAAAGLGVGLIVLGLLTLYLFLRME